MKKIIALALALIMVLSMGVVALAEEMDPSDKIAANRTNAFGESEGAAFADLDDANTGLVAPGEKFVLVAYDNTDGFDGEAINKRDYKVSYDFTSAKYDFDGASLIDSIAWEKNAEASKDAGEPVYDLVLKIKENLTSIKAKDIAGAVTLTHKTEKVENLETGKMEAFKFFILVEDEVNNVVEYVAGAKKAADADDISEELAKNHVIYAEDGAGYVTFAEGDLTGTVKLAKDEKAQVYVLDQEATKTADEDLVDAVEAYLGEDYDAIVEWYNFAGTGFGADVDFRYDAWEEDPHFFYAWDGEKFVDLEAKYDDDEDVDDYVFTAAAKGLIVVTDVEIVAAADTKNPDTGANDVVGVAAALAVVSLVAAGAVSLKK